MCKALNRRCVWTQRKTEPKAKFPLGVRSARNLIINLLALRTVKLKCCLSHCGGLNENGPPKPHRP